jgi:hypothetical protein
MKRSDWGLFDGMELQSDGLKPFFLPKNNFEL